MENSNFKKQILKEIEDTMAESFQMQKVTPKYETLFIEILKKH